VTLARNLKKKSTQKAFFRDAGIVSSEAAQRDARTMGGTSPRDSAPGKRPRGSRVERKSVSCSEKKASAKPRAPPSVLTDASDLVFGKVVGRGTQGTVRLAKHRTTGKRFVVKLLPLETHGYAIASGRAMDLPCDPMSMTDDDARRVVAEAEVLKLASDHPNVVRFHGAFTREVAPSSSSRRTSEHLASGHASVSAARDDPSCDTTAAPSPSSPRASELCIVMSHCEGGDLASLLRRVKQAGPHALLPEDVVMRWLVQLLLGLNHIHRKAILHRDIKPANVFLSKSRKVVRLGDFGIAKKLREDDDLATTVVGTPLYMSPELCQGKPYTYASDIWALGCVAYEMASGGAKAFDAPGWPQLLVKIVRCDYAPVPSHLSRPFAALIASMLSPDPAERPTTEQLLSTPIVRRHCEALLRDARDAKNVFGAESAAADGVAAEASARPGRSSRSSGASSVTTAAFGVSGVAAEKHRSAREGRHVNAAAAADAEKRAAAEARYAARQNALRRDRMAVRDADPKRLAARDRADAEAEKRMARQEARATAEAEAALLVARGYAAPEGCFAQKKKTADAMDGASRAPRSSRVAKKDTPAGRTLLRGEAAFASRPRLDRTEVVFRFGNREGWVKRCVLCGIRLSGVFRDGSARLSGGFRVASRGGRRVCFFFLRRLRGDGRRRGRRDGADGVASGGGARRHESRDGDGDGGADGGGRRRRRRRRRRGDGVPGNLGDARRHRLPRRRRVRRGGAPRAPRGDRAGGRARDSRGTKGGLGVLRVASPRADFGASGDEGRGAGTPGPRKTPHVPPRGTRRGRRFLRGNRNARTEYSVGPAGDGGRDARCLELCLRGRDARQRVVSGRVGRVLRQRRFRKQR
jgi:NIMA (never in mitosis gene a)-related kinase